MNDLPTINNAQWELLVYLSRCSPHNAETTYWYKPKHNSLKLLREKGLIEPLASHRDSHGWGSAITEIGLKVLENYE